MKKITLLTLLLLAVNGLIFAQTKQEKELPEFQVKQHEVEAMLRFLASDELKGRRTGSEGNNIAARYIAANLQAYGFKSPNEEDDYFQKVPILLNKPPTSSSMTLDKEDYALQKDYILIAGAAADLETEAVFVGHGWVDEEKEIDDYADVDVTGKVVFALGGRPDASDPTSVFKAMSIKQKIAREKGAVGLIEIYNLSFPWNFFVQYFGGENMRLAQDEDEATNHSMAYGWIKNILKEEAFAQLKEGKKLKIKLSNSGVVKEKIDAQNVVGILEGSDPELRDEYILLTAHYDHVGVGKQGGRFSEKDSIFNGARDNAMGTIALLTAARSLALQRPKRSVVALAVTAEEVGLLGSSYYADNPLIPLSKTIFDLNSDGAGYNDTRYISVIGFGRTGTDELIKAAATAVDLEVFPNPVPEQGLFDRSDNVSFAQKGVPALNVSPGLTAFDEEIGKYYHQVADEAESVDMAYFLKFCQAYAHLARLIADQSERPQWIKGDKYEEAGNKLYEMNR